MLEIRNSRKVKELWWKPPELPRRDTYFSNEKRNISPETVNVVKPRLVGKFICPKDWVAYKYIGADIGYFTKAFNLKDIRTRYGVSFKTSMYWKNNILPPPIKIALRNGHYHNHWSHIHLIALDVVLQDLWKCGYCVFSKRFKGHVEMFQHGCDVMYDYYIDKYESLSLNPHDKYGVIWI